MVILMIEIKNLYFSYSHKPPFILNDINLVVGKGDYISVLGDNGSGKSTLIKLVLGFLAPSKGIVVNAFGKTGYVPQRLESLNTQFPITVYEVLDTYRKVMKIRDKGCIEQYLDMVKMSDFKNSLIGNLSGGQVQKVFIARALIGNPDLLVLDEPSSGVDASSQAEIYSVIRKVNRDKGIAVISVEHNLKAACENSTLIYHLHEAHGHLCKPEDYIGELISANKGEE